MLANRYIWFVELSSGLIKDSGTPLYSSEYLKRPVPGTRYLLNKRIPVRRLPGHDRPYQDPGIPVMEVPHLTPIQKFCQRILFSTFTRLFRQAHEIVLQRGNNAVSDIMPTIKLPSESFFKNTNTFP